MLKRLTNYAQLGRIRTIKPEFFLHEGLFDLERTSGLPVRLGFAGLWTCCDREGRFPWRPRMLKVRVMPYDEVDFARVLHALATRGSVVPYVIDDEMYGYIPSWTQHQSINSREQASILPAPTEGAVAAAQAQLDLEFDACATREPAVAHACATAAAGVPDACLTPLVQEKGEGKGREGNTELPKAGSSVSAPEADASSTRAARVVFKLPLTDGSNYEVTDIDIEQWRGLYPAVDVPQQLRQMYGWLDAHKGRRKTRRGVRAFIASWLSREQDRGPRGTRPAGARSDEGWRHIGEHQENPAEEQEPAHDPLPEGLDEAAGQEHWAKAKLELSRQLNRKSWETWIKPLSAAGLHNAALYLLVPNPFFKREFPDKYRPAILQVLGDCAVRDVVMLY